jgi:hypothetical protein
VSFAHPPAQSVQIGRVSDTLFRAQTTKCVLIASSRNGSSGSVCPTPPARGGQFDGDLERIELATLYELTELGRSLEEPLSGFALWFEANWAIVQTAQHHWASAPKEPMRMMCYANVKE